MTKKQRNFLLFGLVFLAMLFGLEWFLIRSDLALRGLLLLSYAQVFLLFIIAFYTLRLLLKKPVFFGLVAISLFIVFLEFFAAHYRYYQNSGGLALLQLGEKTTEPEKRFVRLREHRPLQNKKIQSKAYEDDRTVSVRTDREGFILPNADFESPEASVVFLGGSTTACLEVDELSRFPYLVSQLLREEYDRSVVAINAGVTANHSMHSNTILVNKLVDKSPDMVVMMHAINDLMALLRYSSYWNNRFNISLLVDVDNQDFSNNAAVSKVSISSEKAQKIKADFENSLQQFISTCRAWKIKPVLMTQASLFENDLNGEWLTREMRITLDNNLPEFVALYDEMNAITRRLADQHEVLLIDLAEQVPKDADYFYDVVHLNESGTKEVARLISKQLNAYLTLQETERKDD